MYRVTRQGLSLVLGGPNCAWPQGPTLSKSGPGRLVGRKQIVWKMYQGRCTVWSVPRQFQPVWNMGQTPNYNMSGPDQHHQSRCKASIREFCMVGIVQSIYEKLWPNLKKIPSNCFIAFYCSIMSSEQHTKSRPETDRSKLLN